MKFLGALILSVAFSNSFGKCNWCISENSSSINDAESFLNLNPKDQLLKIESEGIKVLILSPERNSGTPFFQWKTIRTDQGKLTDISKLEGSLGKTLCKGERPLATTDYTIVLSSDAPLSTLLHEYLHVKQIKNDKSWCEISKRLWGNELPNPEDIKAVRNHEWDVRKILWSVRNHKALNIEDHIVIAEGMIKESQMRNSFDSSAKELVKREKVEEYLIQQVDSFKQFLMKQTLK